MVKYVIGIDTSRKAEEAFIKALELMTEKDVVVLACIGPDLDLSSDYQADLIKELDKILDLYVEKANEKKVKCEKIVEFGQPGRKLVELVKRESADVLVVGTRGLTKQKEPNSNQELGSVSQYCIFNAPCGVLLFK